MLGVVVLVIVRGGDRPVIVHLSGGAAAGAGSDSSRLASTNPVPVSPGFEGCPPDGDGGDRVLNRRKNRIDSAVWKPMPFAAVLALPWPSGVDRRMRAEWSRSDSVAVSRREGVPISVEGYFAGAKTEGPEATNCHGAESLFRDWHIWLSMQPGKDRRRSIVVETTPAVRATHPDWLLSTIHQLVRDSSYVRISGWLLLDQEHPEQLGKTRGTLWEIHPVMRIEVKRDGRWRTLAPSP